MPWCCFSRRLTARCRSMFVRNSISRHASKVDARDEQRMAIISPAWAGGSCTFDERQEVRVRSQNAENDKGVITLSQYSPSNVSRHKSEE